MAKYKPRTNCSAQASQLLEEKQNFEPETVLIYIEVKRYDGICRVEKNQE